MISRLTKNRIPQAENAYPRHLDVTSACLSEHIKNYAPVNGRLPGGKDEMIAKLDEYRDGLDKDNGQVRSSLGRADRLRQLYRHTAQDYR